ncbi:MAG: hypothetical protein QF464_09655 [Myxococcota bacterium]|jgi:4-hydroxy-tetrahydrodipicolinate reductase|nr:hypothetical protein [Myxococcota bacterium]
MSKPKIVQVGLGPLGEMITDELARRGLGEVVAVVDPARTDIPTHTLEGIDFWDDVDCVIVATRSSLAECAPTFRALLSRGQTVVSTCEELSYPWLRHADLAGDLHTTAERHGGRLLGTGVNPGFLMDTFPLLASKVTRDIEKVSVYRIQDATTRRIPFQQKIGAGLTPAEFEAKAQTGSLRHVGLGESLHFLGDYLGFRFAHWHETLGPVLGHDGLATGVRQVAEGQDDQGNVLVELVFQAAIGQEDPHDRVVIAGDPPVDLVWRGGVHGDLATVNVVLNSMEPLMAGPPGLHTMATIPLAG